MKQKGLILCISLVLLLAMTTADAQAQCCYFNPLLLPFAVAGAVVGTAAAITTAVVPPLSIQFIPALIMVLREFITLQVHITVHARITVQVHITPGRYGFLPTTIVMGRGFLVIGDNSAWMQIPPSLDPLNPRGEPYGISGGSSSGQRMGYPSGTSSCETKTNLLVSKPNSLAFSTSRFRTATLSLRSLEDNERQALLRAADERIGIGRKIELDNVVSTIEGTKERNL